MIFVPLGILNIGSKKQNLLNLKRSRKTNFEVFENDVYKHSLNVYEPSLRNIASMSGCKSMSNILIPMLPERSNSQFSLLSPAFYKKKQSSKYREFYKWIDSDNQLQTHIDLNMCEMKGNISIWIADILSFLRRIRNNYKLPNWVLEFLKTNIKNRRYRIGAKNKKYSLRCDSLVFEYLMRELKLTYEVKRTPMIGPKTLKIGFHKVNPLWRKHK